MATQVRMPDGSIRETSDIEELKAWVGDPAGRTVGMKMEYNPVTRRMEAPGTPGAGGKIVGGTYPAEFADAGKADPSAMGGAVRAGQQADPGRPQYPGIESLIQQGANGPSLAKTLNLGGQLGDSAGYNALKGIATSGPGGSPWEKMMLERQGLEQSGARDAAERSAAGARAMGFSDIARRGGLSRGAMSRMGRNSMLDLAMQRQDIGRQGQLQRLGIGTEAEGQRLGAIDKLTSTDLNAKQFDIQNVLRTKALEDAAKVGKYGEEMKAWASNKQADATAASGGGSCWFVTEISKVAKLPANEPELLTKYKMYVLKTNKNSAEFYIRRCNKLVERMNADGFNWLTMVGWNDSLVRLISSGKLEAARVLFRDTVVELADKYWPDCKFTQLKEMREEMVFDRSEEFCRKEEHPKSDLATPCLTNIPLDGFYANI